jgi:hypothetical protein
VVVVRWVGGRLFGNGVFTSYALMACISHSTVRFSMGSSTERTQVSPAKAEHVTELTPRHALHGQDDFLSQ